MIFVIFISTLFSNVHGLDISFEKLDSRRLEIIENGYEYYYTFNYNENVGFECRKQIPYESNMYYLVLLEYVHGQSPVVITTNFTYIEHSITLVDKFIGAIYTCDLKRMGTPDLVTSINLHLIYSFNMRVEGLIKEISKRSHNKSQSPVVTNIEYTFYPYEEIELRCVYNKVITDGIKTLEMYYDNEPSIVNKTLENTMTNKLKFLSFNQKIVTFVLKLSGRTIEIVEILFRCNIPISIDNLDWKRLQVIGNGYELYYSIAHNEKLDLACNKLRNSYPDYHVQLTHHVNGVGTNVLTSPTYIQYSKILTDNDIGTMYTCSLINNIESLRKQAEIKLYIIYPLNLRVKGLAQNRLNTELVSPIHKSMVYKFYPNEEIELRCVYDNKFADGRKTLQLSSKSSWNAIYKIENDALIYKIKFSLQDLFNVIYFELKLNNAVHSIETVQVAFNSFMPISIENLDWQRLQIVGIGQNLHYTFYRNENLHFKCMTVHEVHEMKSNNGYYVELSQFVDKEAPTPILQNETYIQHSVTLTDKYIDAVYKCSLKKYDNSITPLEVKLRLIYPFKIWLEGMDSEALNVVPNNKPLKGLTYNYYYYPNEVLQFSYNIILEDSYERVDIFDDYVIESKPLQNSGTVCTTKPLLSDYNLRSIKFQLHNKEEHTVVFRVVPLWVEGLSADRVIVTRHDWGLLYEYTFDSDEHIDIRCKTSAKSYIDIQLNEDLNTIGNEKLSSGIVTFNIRLNPSYIGKTINCTIKDYSVPLKHRNVVIKLVNLGSSIATTDFPTNAPVEPTQESNNDWIWQLFVGAVLVICCTYLGCIIKDRLNKTILRYVTKNTSSNQNEYCAEFHQIPHHYDQIEDGNQTNIRHIAPPIQNINEPVPKNLRKKNEIYAEILPKNKRNSNRTQTEAKVDALKNTDNTIEAGYSSIITKPAETCKKDNQDVYTNVQNTSVDKRNSLYEESVNSQTYLNTVNPGITQYLDVSNALHDDRRDDVEPTYCEITN